MARHQSNRASCGPAALHNALAALGVERTEDELIRLTGQTTDGAGVKQILKAIATISSDEHRLEGRAVVYRGADYAYLGLWHQVSQAGRPVILCVDGLDHWVACTGHLGGHFVVIDSADVKLVLHYHWDRLRRRWAAPEKKEVFYGITL